jgi:tetratricopeptide (TPR) repeat protein
MTGPTLRSVAFCAALLLSACASPEESFSSGLWHYKAGLYAQAAPRLVRSVPELEQSNPADPRVLSGYLALGRMASMDAAYEPAENYLKKAIQLARAHHGSDTTLTRNALVEMGLFFADRGRFAEAIPPLQEAVTISQREGTLPRTLYAIDLDNLALAQAGAKNHALARAASDSSLQVLDGLPPTKEVQAARGVVLFNRAYAFAEQGKVAMADAAYKESLALVSAHAEPWRRKVVVAAYSKFLRAQGRDNEALAVEQMAQ